MNISVTPIPERLRIFVASPGDVLRERDHVNALADELNRGVASEAGFVLEVVRWETHARPDTGRPQQLILDQIGAVDIFISIMWQRFGTPTGVADSGSEEEFNHALDSWQQTGRPRMLCYFSLAPIEPPGSVELAEQLLKVARFRDRVGKMALAWTFKSDAEFKEYLREHLQQILLHEFAGRRPPLDRNLLELLNVDKDRCRARNVGYFTPNFLMSLLRTQNIARRIFDTACPGKAESILQGLRAYVPIDAEGVTTTFSDFDWYAREDVQAALRRARLEGKPAIDARHLLIGFLDTESQTRAALRSALGNDLFEHLCRVAQTPLERAGTPGIFGGLMPRGGA